MAVMGSSHLERGRKFNFRRRPIDVTVAYCTSPAWVQCARLCVQTAPKITVYFKALASLEISEVSNQVISEVSKCFSTAPHIRSHRAPCSCFPKQVSLQLSSEQSVGSGGYRIFVRGVRQLVPLECPKPLHALSPSDP